MDSRCLTDTHAQVDVSTQLAVRRVSCGINLLTSESKLCNILAVESWES